MNGELYQIADIVVAARHALNDNGTMKYKKEKYVDKLEFRFTQRSKSATENILLMSNIDNWFKTLKSLGCIDIRMLCSYAVKDRMVLGFSNTSESCILCFFENGDVTYFVPHWEFDCTEHIWNILYTEFIWVNPPLERPVFHNNIDEFKNVLADITKLAKAIGENSFAKIFERAIDILNNKDEKNDYVKHVNIPEIPEPYSRLFEAASISDVFGAMGSWNDSPPYEAHEMGLDNEYNTLSTALLKNIRLATLYAVNEW